MEKQGKSNEEIYKNNQRKAKIMRRIAPILFWSFMALSVLCFFLAIKNSLGNINEIVNLLNSKKFTGEELQANYDYLIEKYGEWVIGNGGAGFTIKFVNIARAAFSGMMVAMFTLSGIFMLFGFLLGKWILPKTAQIIEQNNVDMVNLTVLRNEDRRNEENKNKGE